MRRRLVDFRVVLVRPRNPLNIGAAARAMANFGLSDLVVVKPYPPVWRETVSAVGAEKLVLGAKAVPSLEEAVADSHLVLGTTTTKSRRLERPLVRLPEIQKYIAKHLPSPGLRSPSPRWRGEKERAVARVAIVFGPEKTGLSSKHLRRCHALVTVPTSPATPSMNLGQAVAVCCYELTKGAEALGAHAAASPANARPTAKELNQLVRHALDVFAAAGYLDFLPADDRAEKVRRTFLGWNLRRTDLALLHGIFRFLTKALPSRAG